MVNQGNCEMFNLERFFPLSHYFTILQTFTETNSLLTLNMFCLKISSSSCLNFSWITWVDFGSNCEKKYKCNSHLAKLRKIYEAIPNDVVGQVDYLLFHGVEAQHLHGRVEVLRVDGGLPQAGLVAPEDRRDDVQLLLSQILRAVKHPAQFSFLSFLPDEQQ